MHNRWGFLSTDEREKMRKTILIDRSSSECGGCGDPCLPSEKSHDTLAGYSAKPGDKGCGVVWEYVSSNYLDDSLHNAARRIKPDLQWWLYWDKTDANG